MFHFWHFAFPPLVMKEMDRKLHELCLRKKCKSDLFTQKIPLRQKFNGLLMRNRPFPTIDYWYITYSWFQVISFHHTYIFIIYRDRLNLNCSILRIQIMSLVNSKDYPINTFHWKDILLGVLIPKRKPLMIKADRIAWSHKLLDFDTQFRFSMYSKY